MSDRSAFANSNTGLALSAGSLRMALRPDLGGSIAGLWLGTNAVMRSTEPALLDKPRMAGCYPLVPFSNRVGYRRFRWGGRDHSLLPNFDDNPHAVHGVAWLRAWEVVQAGADSAVLRYRHTPDGHWPYAFEVQQHFKLSDAAGAHSLQMRVVFTALETPGASAPASSSAAAAAAAANTQPVGLGWHPYFPKRSRSRLHIEVSERWDSDAAGLPVRHVAQPGIDADVAHLAFDNCFEGWRGAARLRDEVLSVKLTSSMPYLVVYTPQAKDYYCVEPVSHVSNAIHMADPLASGLKALKAGETREEWMRLEVSAVAPA